MPHTRAVLLLALLAACARHAPPLTGRSLGARLDADTAVRGPDRLRRLAAAESLLASGTPRDLATGHMDAITAQGTLLAALATERAGMGDTAGALRTLDRAMLLGMHEHLLDTLTRSPRWAALRAHPRVAQHRATLAGWRRQWADSAFISPPRDSLPLAERIGGLSLLWAEVRYAAMGLNRFGTTQWDSLYLAMIPRVVATPLLRPYYELLQGMAAAVEDDHLDVSIPDEWKGITGLPLDLRRIGGKVLVTRVRGPALGALGVRPGQELVTVDGRTPAEIAAGYTPRLHRNSTPQAADHELYGWRLVSGPTGAKVALRLRDSDGSERTVEWTRGTPSGAVPLPPVEARRMEGGIGYLGIHTVTPNVTPALIDSAVRSLGDVRAMVIDVRRNGGGGQNAVWTLFARFLRDSVMFTEQYTSAYIPLLRSWGYAPGVIAMPERILRPDRERPLRIPMAWLVGPQTASAAEGLTSIVIQSGIGRTFGEPTYGSTGQPMIVPLPGGGSVRIRLEEERMQDGTVYINKGITPQELVPVTREGLLAGRDEVMDAALRWLRARMR